MHQGLFTGVVVVSLGCAPAVPSERARPDVSDQAGPVEKAVSAVVAEASADEPTPAPLPTPRLAVGWSEVRPGTADPTAEQFKRLRELAKAGDTDAVLSGLPEVLSVDLPRRRTALLSEEVWVEVRKDPRFDIALSTAGKAYGNALAKGTPAFVYTEQADWLERENGRDPQVPYKDLRIGIYDHEFRRFVPMVPPVHRAFSGLLDRERGMAIVARGNLAMKSMWTVQPDRSRALVYSLSEFGELVFEARGVSTSGDRDSYGFVLRLGEEGPPPLWVERIMVDYGEDQYFEWTAKGRKKVGWSSEFAARTPPGFPFGRPSLSVIEVAEARVPAPTHPDMKYTRGKRFVLGDVTVDLEPGHGASALHVSPDPMILAVVTRATYFSTGAHEVGPLPDAMQDRHIIDLVDLHEGTVVRLAKGRGYAHVAWAPDGTFFFETSTRTARVAPGSTRAVEDVLGGVHFGTPPFPEEGGV